MEDLSRTVATMDPIDLMTDLNKELVDRYPKFTFIMAYALFVGFFASVIALMMSVIYVLSEEAWKVATFALRECFRTMEGIQA